MLKATIDLIKNEYLKAENDWYLGFSGGKDSTALLIIILNATRHYINIKCHIHVVFCDTGVEFPLISRMVYDLFRDLIVEVTSVRSDITFEVVKPSIEDRFFPIVIGKGYVPPTFMFRWCTRRLRIKPLQENLYSKSSCSTILLGIREGESDTRDKVISTHRVSEYYTKQRGASKSSIFCPIIHFSVADVWEVLNMEYPTCLNRELIRKLYTYIGSEFFNGKYISSQETGRYGCWVCTVIRKDKAMNGLIANGYDDLIPLRDFIDWLKSIRDVGTKRNPNRMTGAVGKGPFNLETRQEILDRLLKAQNSSIYDLITDEEIIYIKECWKEESV